MVDFVNKQFNKGNFVVCVFVDLAKAFNSLDCLTLVKKLTSLGFGGNMLNLLTDYLINRRQAVNFNGEISSLKAVKFGVPQGSVLGPMLFSIYMDNLPPIFKVLHVKMYADVMAFYCSVNCHNIAEQSVGINKEPELFAKWCKHIKVTLNVEKTKCILYSHYRKVPSRAGK